VPSVSQSDLKVASSAKSALLIHHYNIELSPTT
jgi:hypothetical protein